MLVKHLKFINVRGKEDIIILLFLGKIFIKFYFKEYFIY